MEIFGNNNNNIIDRINEWNSTRFDLFKITKTDKVYYFIFTLLFLIKYKLLKFL